MQAPGGPTEDISGGVAHGGWVFPTWTRFRDDHRRLGSSRRSTRSCSGWTCEIFAGYWPGSGPERPVAGAQLAAEARSLADAESSTGRVELVRDAVAGVRLKRRSGPAAGARQRRAAQTLIAHDLIDEYRLLVFLVVLGTASGLRKRHRPGGHDAGTATTRAGVAFSVYRRAER